jgi:hypothetical protein
LAEDLENPRVLGGAERGLGLVELESGNHELAEEHFRRSRRIFDQLGWIKMASSSKIYLGFIAAIQRRVEESSELLMESLAYQDREQDAHSIAHILFILGLLALNQGYDAVAKFIITLASQMQEKFDVVFPPHLQGAIDDAQDLLESSIRLPSDLELTWQECVGQMLIDPPNWLTAIAEKVETSD